MNRASDAVIAFDDNCSLLPVYFGTFSRLCLRLSAATNNERHRRQEDDASKSVRHANLHVRVSLVVMRTDELNLSCVFVLSDL